MRNSQVGRECPSRLCGRQNGAHPARQAREVLAIRLTNVSGAANKLRAELTQQLHDARVSQEEAWEAQLLLHMLGHRAWKHKLGQHFTDALFE